ncbi:IS630 family transposase [Chromohalobacter sarecensis]|uniref:IS630 family transposase n=1 Tax=Chromohalobacter sarecensis TaxID=245294 RepID=A0ABV9D1W4_9GAMM|nr:IS630 family transposase [Chromohalobacter sarecensis]MCK0716484.1 IS630 family transposase [Chromohalobacter sarecensis]
MARRFVTPLTDAEQQTLTSAYQHGEKRALRRRAHAILLSGQGHTINQISEVLQVRRDAVSRWLKQWEVSGLDGLIDKPRSGRTPILDEHDHERLQALVAEHPHQIRSLQARLQEETGKTISTVTLRRVLKKNRHSFKRIRRSLKKRRDETDFRNTQGLLKALQAREDRGEHALYYFDESGFSQSSSVPYAWSPIGQPWEVTAYSHSRRLNVLGFLSRTGKLIYHTTSETVTTETVIEAFDQFVAQKDPDAFAVVVLDNAKMHRSKAFQRKIIDWMAHRVHLVYLSAYSPELNLIEILWRRMKYAWLPLSAYLTFDRLCNEVHRLLRGYGTEHTINYE